MYVTSLATTKRTLNGRISTLNPPTRVNQLQRMPLPGLLTQYLEKTRIIQRSTSKKSMVDSLK